MKRLTDYVFVRHAHNWKQLFRFGLVGGSGVLVNQVVLVAANKIARGWFGIHREDAVLPLVIGDLHIRWYHVFIALGFLVANFTNFLLNRHWTFKSARHTSWLKEYWPFLSTGLFALALGLLVSTALMHPGSPVSLPTSVFDDSSGLRNKLYWANLIQIVLVTPVNYVINKLWTFRAVRKHRPEHAVPDEHDNPTGDDVRVP